MIVNYYVLIGWCVIWLVLKLSKTDILIANTFATFSILISVFLINRYAWLAISHNIRSFSLSYFTLFSVVITIIVLISHLEVFKNLVNKKSNS